MKLAPAARAPEREPGFVSLSRGDQEIVIEHDGSLRPFAAGDVLGGTLEGGFLVKVVSARAVDATHFAIETAPAAITDFIAEGELHVRYDASGHASASGEVAETGDEGGSRIGSGAEALTIAPAPIKIADLSGVTLPASCGLDRHASGELDVSARFSPSIEVDLKIGKRGPGDPRPELKKFRVVVTGTVDVDVTLRASGAAAGHCAIPLADLAGLPKIPLPDITFWAGPVPIVIDTDLKPRLDASVALAFDDADVRTRAHTTTSIQVGVAFENKKWTTIWAPSCTSKGEAEIEAPGEMKASAKVGVGGELRARLYGVLGPSLGIQTFARADAGTVPPYCAYEVRTDCGIEGYARVEAGISVGPLDLTLASLDLVNFELLHGDGPVLTGDLRDAPECTDRP